MVLQFLTRYNYDVIHYISKDIDMKTVTALTEDYEDAIELITACGLQTTMRCTREHITVRVEGSTKVITAAYDNKLFAYDLETREKHVFTPKPAFI